MPFTPSHIAAVLPFVRRPVAGWAYAPAALVIGSMIPDVPLFTRHWPAYAETHSVKGILTVDVIATCAAVALYYLVFRTALLQLLPRAVADRIRPPTRLRQPAHLVWVPVAAAFGAATHAFWDSFTHARSVVIWGPRLGAHVFGHPVHQLLQYFSTVMGLAVLTVWAVGRLRRSALQPSPGLRLGSRTRVTAVALLVVATGLGAMRSVLTTPHPDELAWHLHWAAIGGCSLAAVTTTAYAVVFTVVQAAARTISGRALPPRSETTASGVPSGPSTP